MISKLPYFTKNFYFLFGLFCIVWMLFIDSNDFITQFKLRSKLRSLEDDKAYYQEKIEEVKKERKELLSDKKNLEKFAREKYLMRKKTEDVYVVTKEE